MNTVAKNITDRLEHVESAEIDGYVQLYPELLPTVRLLYEEEGKVLTPGHRPKRHPRQPQHHSE